MKRNINTTNFTKDFIESKVSSELIVSKYLNIDIDIIKNCIDYNELIHSPFRENDPHPSCGFKYNNKGKLKIKDFGGFFHGDIYDLVAYVMTNQYNKPYNVSNKQDFYSILKHIAYTFRDIIEGKEIDENHDKQLVGSARKLKYRKPIIDLVVRNWYESDKVLWGKWRVSLQFLNGHFVYPVEQYYINKDINPMPSYYYKESDPCYAYVLGVTANGTYNIKLYFPNRDRETQNKFITNCNVLEGLPSFTKEWYDIIIITKSSKDRLCINNMTQPASLRALDIEDVSVGVINVPSENYKLTQKEYDYIISKLSNNGVIISFMDFDRQGRECAKYLNDEYAIPYMFITNGELGLPNYGVKDFAELIEAYSITTIKEFIKLTYERIYK